mmetsp:Transcript_3129/g.9443  ORF Transcript_3129/g.9443 Transcript_3129/m.9443 type:complete len:214 (+) Transcript_3129:545-1186(+)
MRRQRGSVPVQRAHEVAVCEVADAPLEPDEVVAARLWRPRLHRRADETALGDGLFSANGHRGHHRRLGYKVGRRADEGRGLLEHVDPSEAPGQEEVLGDSADARSDVQRHACAVPQRPQRRQAVEEAARGEDVGRIERGEAAEDAVDGGRRARRVLPVVCGVGVPPFLVSVVCPECSRRGPRRGIRRPGNGARLRPEPRLDFARHPVVVHRTD